MQQEKEVVGSFIRDGLSQFTQRVWGKPQAVSELHSQGFEYINLKEYLRGFQVLFGGGVEEKILVRDEYRIAAQKLQTDKYYRGAYVTGQPGIGKSLFLIYLLVQLLGRRCKVAVHNSSHHFYAVFGKSVAFYPLTESAPLALGGSMWALSASGQEHGGAPPTCFYDYPGDVRLIQATSPERKRWHGWSKKIRARCCVVDIWTEQEIANLAYLLGYNVQRMVDLGKKWGGVPRTLVTYLDDPGQRIEKWYRDFAAGAVENCQKTLQAIMGCCLPEGSDASQFYFCRPADYATSSIDRTRTWATVPTQTICNILAEALKGLSDAIKLEFFAALSRRNDTRRVPVFIYRAWFHCFITTVNKSIYCHWLSKQDNVTKLYGTTNIASESARELKVRKELPYYWPATTGYPGIDGALICNNAIFAFQMTINSTRTSPEPGVRKLRDELPAHLKDLPWRVVFVGIKENLSEVVARQLAGKVFLMNTSQSAVPIAWSTEDPVALDVTYKMIGDEDESMEVVNE